MEYENSTPCVYLHDSSRGVIRIRGIVVWHYAEMLIDWGHVVPLSGLETWSIV